MMRRFLVSVGFVATSFLVVLPISAAEYEVEKGDSLWAIAQEHSTTVEDLKEINNLDSDLIFPKQMLEIDREITYNVEKGDTLSEIALDNSVTVSDLKEWNNLETDLIIIGEKLTIKVDEAKSEANQTEEEVQQENNNEETPEASEPVVETQADASDASEEETADSEESSEQSGETISMTATAYTAECDGCSGVTATGIDLLENRNMKVIAVDPSVIPLGTRVHVEGYGEAIAADTGGAIKGNKIDIHVPTKDEANDWGVRTVDVTILD